MEPDLASAKYLSSTFASKKIHLYMRSQVCDTYEAVSLTWHMRHVHCHLIQEHAAICSENHHLWNGKWHQWTSRNWGRRTNTKKIPGGIFYTSRLCLELQTFEKKNFYENWIWQQPYRVEVRLCLAIQCFSHTCLQEFIAVMKCKTHYLYWALWFQQVEENIRSSVSVASSYSLLKHVLQLLFDG